jgi:UPF0176 protein
MYKIVSFYEFKPIGEIRPLEELRDELRSRMRDGALKGTIIIAEEGFNAAICGETLLVDRFMDDLEGLFETRIEPKVSFGDLMPFRRIDVKIKPEIVTLKREANIEIGIGTHVEPAEWNRLLADPDVVVLDTRNDYEYQTGTFEEAINPRTAKFSELPEFVERSLADAKDKKIAIFCTGGIRCEKFAPYLLARGFQEVYQLKGGILKYLEEVPKEESLWRGECFVFDQRISLDQSLQKGDLPDLSQNLNFEDEAASE